MTSRLTVRIVSYDSTGHKSGDWLKIPAGVKIIILCDGKIQNARISYEAAFFLHRCKFDISFLSLVNATALPFDLWR